MKLSVLPDLAKSVAGSLSNKFSEWISKQFPALNYFPENIELIRVNGVFRSKSLFKSKLLYIGVEWADGEKSSLPIEMASLAAPGRVYKGKEVTHEAEYERVAVTILRKTDTDKSSPHHRYTYQTDCGLVSFSGFELARTLFWHNRHLVQASYAPNGLSELAFVDRSSSPITVRFPESTSYPVSYLKTRKARAHLTWLLLDQEARRSFFTIYENFQKKTDSIAFDFSPPDLEGWKLELSVVKNAQFPVFEVQRVESILEACISEKFFGVEIFHPKNKLKTEQDSNGNEKRGITTDVDIDPELNMENIPSFGKRLHSHNSKGFSFNVSGIQGAALTDGKESSKPSPISIERESENSEQAGLGSPERVGEGQEFDPVLNQDEEIEEAVELPQKFLIFEQVVKELGQSKGINLELVKCGVFPDPTNNSRVVFQTKDENKLRFFIAILDIQQSKIILLEADTNSLDKPKGASTLILGLKGDGKAHLKEIVQHFSDSGAQWRHQFIRQRSYFFMTCNHPRLKAKGKVLEEGEYKEKWVKTLKAKLSVLLEQES